MVAETPSSEYSEVGSVERRTDNIIARRSSEEENMRLRELELHTNFQINTLSESLNFLKRDFVSWRESLNDKLNKNEKDIDTIKTRLTIAIVIVLGQMAIPPGMIFKLFGG